LRRARLIIDVHLKNVADLFKGAGSGIGQLEVEDLSKEF